MPMLYKSKLLEKKKKKVLIKFLACKTAICTLLLYPSPIPSALHSILVTSLLSSAFPEAYREDRAQEKHTPFFPNVYTGS